MEFVNIILDNKVIGSAQIIRCGLYLRFRCDCELPDDSMYRLWITGIEEAINLGILSPYNGRFVLDKKIAVNRIGYGEISLRALPVNQKSSVKFIPLNSNAPFQYIEQLYTAKFGFDDDIAGIYITDTLR